jgi:hypothetical protein
VPVSTSDVNAVTVPSMPVSITRPMASMRSVTVRSRRHPGPLCRVRLCASGITRR